MNKKHLQYIVLFLLILNYSCSIRLIKYRRVIKKYNKKEISKSQFDSFWNTMFTINRINFVKHPKVKTTGSYISTSIGSRFDSDIIEEVHNLLKFTDTGYMIMSSRFFGPLNEKIFKIIEETSAGKYRYSNINGEIVFEYILFRDLDIINYWSHAKVSSSGDTLTFYKTVETKHPERIDKKEKSEVFIYHPEFIVNPKIRK